MMDDLFSLHSVMVSAKSEERAVLVTLTSPTWILATDSSPPRIIERLIPLVSE